MKIKTQTLPHKKLLFPASYEQPGLDHSSISASHHHQALTMTLFWPCTMHQALTMATFGPCTLDLALTMVIFWIRTVNLALTMVSF